MRGEVSNTPSVRFPLVEAVEALQAKGYVVLTAEQAEETTTVLGAVAYDDPAVPVEKRRERAERLLSEWP